MLWTSYNKVIGSDTCSTSLADAPSALWVCMTGQKTANMKQLNGTRHYCFCDNYTWHTLASSLYDFIYGHFKICRPAGIPLSSAWYGDISWEWPSEGPAPSYSLVFLFAITQPCAALQVIGSKEPSVHKYKSPWVIWWWVVSSLSLRAVGIGPKSLV